MMTKHLLPQAGPQIIVAASLGTGGAILAESALSYLGLGVQPPTASWGNALIDPRIDLDTGTGEARA